MGAGGTEGGVEDLRLGLELGEVGCPISSVGVDHGAQAGIWVVNVEFASREGGDSGDCRVREQGGEDVRALSKAVSTGFDRRLDVSAHTTSPVAPTMAVADMVMARWLVYERLGDRGESTWRAERKMGYSSIWGLRQRASD